MSTDPAFRPDPQNANKGTARGQSFVNRSIRERGAARSGVAAKDGTMIAGSQTLGEVAALGLPIRAVHTRGDEWIVVVRDDIEPGSEAARLLALEDNRSSEVGLDWDPAVLATLDPPLLEGLWRPEELAELLATIPPDVIPGAGGDAFDTTPAEGPTRCQLGDVWALGSHRLLVGDCTQADAVARLFGEARAEMVFTDPPYGVAYRDHAVAKPGSKLRKSRYAAIENDEYDPAQIARVVGDAAALCATVCDGAVYVCHPDALPTRRAIEDAFVAAGWPWKHTIIWAKPSPGFGFSDFRNQHECIFYSRPKGEFYAGRDQFTIWEYGREGDCEHPTQKPVDLVKQALENNSKAGAIVYDPFLGSGTTLIAAHRTGRVCYGLEVEPKYADVILRRAEAEGIAPITRLAPGAPDA